MASERKVHAPSSLCIYREKARNNIESEEASECMRVRIGRLGARLGPDWAEVNGWAMA